MYQYLDFDVESFEDNIDEFAKICKIRPSKNLKDPEKIKKNIGEKLAKIKSEAALSWYTSRPITICLFDPVLNKSFSFNDPNPKDLLNNFCNTLVCDYPDHILCGKNSIKFDLPIITGWLIKYDLGVPEHFKRHLAGRPLQDIDNIFGFSTTMNSQISTLENYAFGMGIKGKTLEGSKVGDLYKLFQMTNDTSKLNEIVDYCHNDVAIVSEFRKRFQKNFIPKIKEIDNAF